MTPHHAVARAVCVHLGLSEATVDETARNFAGVIGAAIGAFVDALPPPLAQAVRDHLQQTGDPT